MSRSCNGAVTPTCNLRGECCEGIRTCRDHKFLCATNITDTCDGGRCKADNKTSVCCPDTAQCCLTRGRTSCCIEAEVWWKWPALLASSAFLLLTFALLYYTYKSTRSSRRNDRHVIHFDDMPPVQPPPYHLHHGYMGVLMKEYSVSEAPPEYMSREGTPQTQHNLAVIIRSSEGDESYEIQYSPQHTQQANYQIQTAILRGTDPLQTIMSLSNLSDSDNFTVRSDSVLEVEGSDNFTVRSDTVLEESSVNH
ncbi:uncharacterized protein LOC134820064 isoform X2 [Bolinopsis microptera]|uniref:uncharacterized protein LOC134820064 isoform X2 n=1 Tax=Bolinopsis microptera TaxID=2820187 RepID=UPI00307AD689